MKYFVDYLPVTTGNELTLYTDGKDYCADLYAALAAAKRVVFLTGLHFMADFRLLRTGTSADAAYRLARVLADAAERGVDVFLLVNQFWTDEMELNLGKTAPIRQRIMKGGELHGYLPQSHRLFHELSGYKNIQCRTDIHPHSNIFGTNHQKTVVIDDTVAFLGGIDLTFLDGDRWDTHAHVTDNRAIDRTQKFWHDVHLQVQGPAVQFVRANFVQRWTFGNLHVLFTGPGQQIGIGPDRNRPPLPKSQARDRSPYVYPSGTETPDKPTVQIVRSMPHRDSWKAEKPHWNKSSDKWERSCKDAYLIGIRSAEQYIYLENQWVADEQIWEELATAATRNKNNKTFRIIVMVPYEGLFAAGLGSNQELWIGDEMEEVINNSHDEGTFGVYAMEKAVDRAGTTAQIYIHSKILIVDDKWSLIGSANAGGISLEGIRSGRDQPDSELSAIILDTGFATRFRQALWGEHLGRQVAAKYDVRDADEFRRLAGQPLRNKLRFFPGYDKVKRGRPTWWPVTPRPEYFSVEPFRKASRIVPSFPDSIADSGVPPTLLTASFRAHVSPNPPPGYRPWYRWRCDLFYEPKSGFEPERVGVRLRMRSLRYDRDDVWDYSDQETVYIGEKTAKYIDHAVADAARGRILCRVQIIPRDEGPDPENSDFPSLLLEYELLFMNARFARNNHPEFIDYVPTR